MAQLNFLNDFQGHDKMVLTFERDRLHPDDGYILSAVVSERGLTQECHRSMWVDLSIDCLDSAAAAAVQAFLWGDDRTSIQSALRRHHKDAVKFARNMRKERSRR